MRVLIVSHYVLPHLGGIEVLVDEAARRLAQRGHSVVLAAAHSGSHPGSEQVLPNLRVERWPAANPLERRFHVPVPLFGPAAFMRLVREVQRADVVHVHGALQPLSLAALALGRRTGRRTLLTEHVGLIHYDAPAVARVQRLVLRAGIAIMRRAADIVTVYNRRVGDQLVALGLPADRVRWIPNGVDTNLFRPPALGERAQIRAELGLGNPERPRALFIGRATPRKGLHLFAAAASDRFDRVVIPVRGLPGPIEGLDRCIVLPPRPRAELARLYRACDVLALPSHGEGLPVTAQEAMASGLALVLGDDPGYADYVQPSFGACVPLRPDAIRAAIEHYAANPTTRATAARASRARAERHFSWDAVLDQYEALYRGTSN